MGNAQTPPEEAKAAMIGSNITTDPKTVNSDSVSLSDIFARYRPASPIPKKITWLAWNPQTGRYQLRSDAGWL